MTDPTMPVETVRKSAAAISRSTSCSIEVLRRRRGQAWVQGSPAHAKARLRLRVGQQGPRHQGAAGLPGSQKHPAHGALHRIVVDPVQELLAGVTTVNHVRFTPKSGH
jgi:hypothetical protein